MLAPEAGADSTCAAPGLYLDLQSTEKIGPRGHSFGIRSIVLGTLEVQVCSSQSFERVLGCTRKVAP